MGTSSNFGNMFSMAGAALLLPFLPMQPIQVLLNNLLYDISEVPIPLDEVDEEAMATPRHWDIAFIRRFMLVLGPVSSIFDFLTFGLLLWGFHASEKLFQTGWFIESLATQVLVIFVIRTRGNPFRSRPNRLLVAASLGILALALSLPYSPLAGWLGFVPLPLDFLAAIAGLVIVYLCLAQLAKTWFYRHLPPVGQPRAAVLRTPLPLMRR
jgi:Mg2+-importing ATPase